MRLASEAAWRRPLIALGSLFVLACASVQAQELTTRIVGGSVVPDDRYPFMAALYNDPDGDGNFLPSCGGSLIGARWVLTAAHCLFDFQTQTVTDASATAVLLGARNLISEDGVFLSARRVIVHPAYDPRTNVADIALIELSGRVDGTGIALPSADSAVPENRESLVVAGWGLTTENGQPSADLREVSLPVVSHAQCLPFYAGALQARAHFCAGGGQAGGRDSCQGDSGGPLFANRDGTLVQAGVVSFGDGCGRPGIPGVYTRVTSYVDWVASFVDDVSILSLNPGGNDPDDQVSDLQIPVLVAGDPGRSGSLLRGEVDLFEVTGSSRVELLTTGGDADLFIFRGVQFRTEDVICESLETTPLDTCAIPSTSERVFASVFGYEDSDYVIDVDGEQPSGDDPSAESFFGSGGGGLDLLLITGLLGLVVRRTSVSRSTRLRAAPDGQADEQV